MPHTCFIKKLNIKKIRVVCVLLWYFVFFITLLGLLKSSGYFIILNGTTGKFNSTTTCILIQGEILPLLLCYNEVNSKNETVGIKEQFFY